MRDALAVSLVAIGVIASCVAAAALLVLFWLRPVEVVLAVCALVAIIAGAQLVAAGVEEIRRKRL